MDDAMKMLKRLAEATTTSRFQTVINNIDTTIKTAQELLAAGAQPTSEQLKQIWLAHEALEVLYGQAEKARLPR